MDRRTAIAVAVAAGGTVLAAGAAFATNVGLLEPEHDQVGRLEPLNVGALLTDDDPSSPHTIVVDVPPTSSAGNGAVTNPAAGDPDDRAGAHDDDERDHGAGDDGIHEDVDDDD